MVVLKPRNANLLQNEVISSIANLFQFHKVKHKTPIPLYMGVSFGSIAVSGARGATRTRDPLLRKLLISLSNKSNAPNMAEKYVF